MFLYDLLLTGLNLETTSPCSELKELLDVVDLEILCLLFQPRKQIVMSFPGNIKKLRMHEKLNANLKTMNSFK